MGININLLAIDDEQIVLDSIKKALKTETDYTIDTVNSVDDALKILNEKPIHVILTDLMMPEIDGLGFMKILQDMKYDALVIMITGYATINTAIQAMQLGAFDYIAKPFTREELKRVVHRAAELVANHILSENVWQNPFAGKAPKDLYHTLKGIGNNSWIMVEDEGTVLIGVERTFLVGFGKIQTISLPSEHDELRQGSVYFQLFSEDLRSESLLSPLSGVVCGVNQKVLNSPNNTLQDPYGEGWLIRIEPSNFEEEIKMMGL